MKHSEILQAAKQLLIDKGWTQGQFARTAEGNGTSSVDPKATCFCMVGALRAINVNFPLCDAMEYLQLGCIPEFNDTVGRTLEQVLQKFDEAIERAKNAELD